MGNTFDKLLKALGSLWQTPADSAALSDVIPVKKFDDGWSWIPDWNEIFQGNMDEWHKRVEAAKNGPRVLIATCTGGNSAMTPMESLMAVALTLRGAAVEIVLCDKVLPACPNMITTQPGDQEDLLKRGPNKCDWCFDTGYKCYEALGLPIHLLSQWGQAEDKAEAERLSLNYDLKNARDFIDRDVLVGHHALTGTLRYFGRGDFNGEPLALDIFRRYLQAGILANRALQRLFEAREFKHTVLNQGIYVPQGVVVGAARKFASTVAAFELAYRKKSIMIDDWTNEFEEKVDVWQALPWNDHMQKQIVDYLNSRRQGTLDWIQVQSADGPNEVSQIAKQLGMDPNKPTIALLTNVVWDAQVFYPTNALQNMIEWLRISIEYFARRPELQLLIRIHPGELQGFVKSRQLVMDEIRRMFPQLPSNIFVIPPESPINTYAAIDRCNAILIYATTAGIELAGVGYKVIVAGEAWVRNKGFSYDATSEANYFELLDGLPFADTRLSPEKLQRAQKFAYHHYFRRMIPLEMLQPQDSDNVPYTIQPVGIEGFMSGKDEGLDIICDGILKRTAFVYPYEKVYAEQADPVAHEFFTIGNRA